MQQKELATLLGVSPAIVSRHVRRGMPTDSLERAQKWRRRHLEPGRVKGARYTPSQAPAPEPENLPCLPDVLPRLLNIEIEAAGELVDRALARGNLYGAAIRTAQLRELFRQNYEESFVPRLTLRTWLALMDYVLHQAADIRHAPNAERRMTPTEFAEMCGPYSAGNVLFDVCDDDDEALNGWPEYPDDPEWVEMMAEDRAESANLRCSRVFGG